MKYYGSVYKGNIDIYDVKGLQECESAYAALKIANCEWNSDPEKEIARVLVVIRASDSSDESVTDDKAYFQFVDSNSCDLFIEHKREIVWSTAENQRWNGNATQMG